MGPSESRVWHAFLWERGLKKGAPRHPTALWNPLPDGGSKFSSPPAVNWSRRRAEMALEIELEPDGTTGGCSTPWVLNSVASYFLPVALHWILLSLLELTVGSVWIFVRL